MLYTQRQKEKREIDSEAAASMFRFINLMFRYYETFRYGCISHFIMCNGRFARENRNNVSKEPFAINFEKLSYYLQLTPSQTGEVANINEFFLDKQRESLCASESQQQKKMHQAVYGNLKLMKKVLTPDQYRKYVTLLNVTNNNNRALNL